MGSLSSRSVSRHIVRWYFFSVLCCSVFWGSASFSDDSVDIAKLSLEMFVVQGAGKKPVVEKLVALNDKSLIPTFVLAMRWTGSNVHVAKALSDLTGESITNWNEATTGRNGIRKSFLI